ncbi:EI24 domain-containing protein [Novosphingobium tardum]|uniref:EI24 domain-containing protein n=2 Tax=Novosphingobium tardum TaxID=1538021 RepID=A0ABV8RLU0_9SPHN
MFSALSLALGQLSDRRILAVLVKTLVVTLAVFAALGWLGWIGIGWALGQWGAGQDFQTLLAVLLAVVLGWVLFRIVALAVLQLFADDVVLAVEARHYPAAALTEHPLGWHRQVQIALQGVLRSLGYNLAALPVALLVMATGLGPAIVFGLVNAVLLGRELTEMVALRHRDADGLPPLPPALTRLALGAIVVALLLVPFVNLLAPVLGAAMATHIVHRKLAAAHAA